MRAFVLLACFLVGASARAYPDVNQLSGYVYNGPDPIDVVPNNSVNGPNQYNGPTPLTTGSASTSFGPVPSGISQGIVTSGPSYTSQVGGSNYPSFGPSSSGGSGGRPGVSSGQGISSSFLTPGPSGAGGSNGGGASEGNSATVDIAAGFGGYKTETSSSGGTGQTKYVAAPNIHNEPIIVKNFYVHAAPEDEDEADSQPQFVPVGQPKKTYKVIFIKAPSGGSGGRQVIPVYPQNEEKTIVYVLAKKPSAIDQDIIIPTPAPTEPSKPEVFFIKYKTQKEAIEAAEKIKAQFDEGNVDAAGIAAQVGAEYANDEGTDVGVSAGPSGVSGSTGSGISGGSIGNIGNTITSAVSGFTGAVGQGLSQVAQNVPVIGAAISNDQPQEQQQQVYLPPNH